MKALSQSDYGLIRSLYQDVYAPDIAESILDEFTDEDLDDLTDEYIEEQVIEFFEECLEEGLDIDIVEQTICESVDTELEVLTEVTNPAKVAAMRMRDKTSAASGEGQKSGRDAGSMARAKLKVSKQKVGSASPEKKASKLSQIKGAVKKVGQAAKGGIGLATRAVGTAVRAGSAVKSAAKKGYERGRQGSGGGSSSSSSDSGSSSSSGTGSSSSSSDSGSSSSSGTGPSSSSSSGGGSSSAAPRKRKDGLLKRGLKKVVRGISKGVSAAAGAVKAGADSLTDRARKEDMNYNKELATIKELYRQVCDNQNKEELEQIDEMVKSDAGVRSRMKISGYEPPTNWDPEANRGKGATVSPKQAEKRRRKSLRQEELEATGLFTAKEIEALVESENVDEAMSSYDRNRKRAAQRAADRNAARAAGKTGVVPGVGYVTPRREKETYTDEKGTVRHKSGAKNEELELDENRRAARAAGGYKDDSKKQTDPSKAGFTGISNSIADIMRQNKEIEARKKKSGAKNEELEHLDELSKGTMGSYVKKASKDVEKRSYTQGSTDAEDAEIGYPGQTPKDKKIDKRQKGIGKAVDKMTRKEELESLRQAYLSISNGGEHLDEISLSEGEQPNIEYLNRYGGHPEVKPKKKKKTPFEKENPGHSDSKPTARFTKADREEMLRAKKEASDKVAADARRARGKK